MSGALPATFMVEPYACVGPVESRRTIRQRRRRDGGLPLIWGGRLMCRQRVRRTIPASKISTPRAKPPLWLSGPGESSWEAVMFTIEELARIPLFSTLGDKELEYLAGSVEDVHLIAGEYVGHEGEARSLAIVVEGKAELTKLVNGLEQVIGVRHTGEVGGEVPMTLGTPLPASMRAVEPSRVLKMTVEVFHTLAAMAPQISETVGAAAMQRMEMLRNATTQAREPAIFVIGPRVDPGVHDCDVFLHRNQIPFERLDPDDPAALEHTGGNPAAYPVVVLRDGTRLTTPTMRAVATVAGLTVEP